MAADVQNADLIRAVLDGKQLQFRHSGQWVDCGGDAQSWLTLLVIASTRNNRYRIKPAAAGVTVLDDEPKPPSVVDASSKAQ